MLRYSLTAALPALFLAVAVAADDAPKPADAPKKGKMANPLVGTYKIVAGEESGQPTSRDKIDGSLVRITKNQMIGVDKDDNQVFIAKYKIVSDKKPWKLTMTTKTPDGTMMQSPALITTEGNQVKVIYSLPGAPEPTEFKTQKGQNMFVMEKVAVDKNPKD